MAKKGELWLAPARRSLPEQEDPDLALGHPYCIRTPQAAAFLGVRPRTLEKWRRQGSGPPFRKLNGVVVYETHDLRVWIDQRTCTSTQQVPERSGGWRP